MLLLLVQNKNTQTPFIDTDFFNARMPLPVMTCANADAEPKYQNANTGRDTIFECHYQ
jgi:hypothetical protein